MFRASGFTLLELLLVMGILGLLMAALLPNYLQGQRRAYDTQAIACGHALLIEAVTRKTSLDLPFQSAQDLLQGGGVRPCLNPQLSVQTLSHTTQGFEYTVTHAQGLKVAHVTQHGVNTAPHP